MTDKRFTINYDITTGNYCLHDDMKAKGVDGYIAYLSDEERANNLCDLLNELYSENQELRLDNDIKFWKQEFMIQHNRTQLILHELSLAINEGYEVSDEFKEMVRELKEKNKETMKKHKRLFE